MTERIKAGPGSPDVGARGDLRSRLAELIKAHQDAIADEGVRRTISDIPFYTSLTPEQMRPRTAAGFRALEASLRDPGNDTFARLFGDLGKHRAREGLRVQDLEHLLIATEDIVRDLIHRHIDTAEERLEAVEACHAACGAARTALFDSYWEASTEILNQAKAQLEALSTPLLPIYPGVLVMPLVSTIDTARAARIMEILLEGVAAHRTETLIFDMTGVPTIDEAIASALYKVAGALKLLGASVVVTGINPAVAQVIAKVGFDMTGITTLMNLQTGLEYALARRGMAIAPRRQR